MINFPTSLDTFTNPTATDQVASVTVPHATQHANANDAIEALEAKVGADGSAVTTSHDYKLSGVTGSDKASSLAGVETLENKTLTEPILVNGGFIADENGNELIEATTTASAVNHINTTNAATGNDPLIDAKGSDANISLKIKGKGTGKVKLGAVDLQFPNVDGSANQTLITNGSGVLSWASPSTGATTTTMIPKSSLAYDAYSANAYDNNTTLYFGLIDVIESMTLNSVTIFINSYTASGTVKIALFTQDGATKLWEVTTATISAGGQKIKTNLSSPYALTPGKYYIAHLITGTGNFETARQNVGASLENAINFVTGENYYVGKKTGITASTMPSSFDPTASVTVESTTTLLVRFEN